MTAFNFPSSPTAGQTYPSPPIIGKPLYTWDGEKWTTIGGNIGAGYAPIDSPLFTGDPRAPTPAPDDNDNSLATTSFVAAKINAIPPPATTAEFFSNSAPSKLISVGTMWNAAQWITLSDVSGSITPDFANGLDFFCNLTAGGRVLQNPLNVTKGGQKGLIMLVGGAIGSWGSAYKFPNGIKPISSGGWDVLSFQTIAPTFIICTFGTGFA